MNWLRFVALPIRGDIGKDVGVITGDGYTGMGGVTMFVDVNEYSVGVCVDPTVLDTTETEEVVCCNCNCCCCGEEEEEAKGRAEEDALGDVDEGLKEEKGCGLCRCIRLLACPVFFA